MQEETMISVGFQVWAEQPKPVKMDPERPFGALRPVAGKEAEFAELNVLAERLRRTLPHSAADIEREIVKGALLQGIAEVKR